MKLSTLEISSRAGTWVSKAARHLQWDATHSDSWTNGYATEQLLVVILEEANDLVGLLNDDDFNEYDRDRISRAARDLHVKLRSRALAAKLENVEGRTVEEAVVYRAKAAELRGDT
jgi:hypothetical protein